MDKVDVNGPRAHPVYDFLRQSTPDNSDIKWNFADYWLVNSLGNATRLTSGKNSPVDFVPSIEEAVDQALNEAFRVTEQN